MSQKVIIAILAGIIILGGGAWYYQNSGAGAERAAGEREGGAKERDGSVMDTIKDGAGGLADVFGGGDAAECRFSGKDPETGEYSEGVVYVDGESFRMEADTVVDGQEVRMYIIQHEHVMYMWSDGEAEGIMMDMSAFADMEGAEKPESPIDWLKDPESGADYDCKGWSANARSFEPPEDISFIDMFGGLGEAFGEMFEQGMADPSMWGGDAGAGY
jgi:hypothetical protein